MKPFLLFLFLDVALFLGYGLAVFFNFLRRIFRRHTKA
jgi:hypothetical protein